MMRELTGGCVRWPRDLAPDKLALFFERPDLEACQSHFSLAAKREVHRIMYSVNETNYHVTHAAVCCCLHCLSFKGSTLGVVVVNISAADGLTPCMPPTQNVIIARLSCMCVLGPWRSAHVGRRQKHASNIVRNCESLDSSALSPVHIAALVEIQFWTPVNRRSFWNSLPAASRWA
jgi:hypothetical protein